MKKRIFCLLLSLVVLTGVLSAGVCALPASAAAAIDYIEITIPEPTGDELIAFEASVPEDADYIVMDYDDSFGKNGVRWLDSEGELSTTDSCFFEGGETYTVQIRLTIKPGCTAIFGEASVTSAFVNGNAATVEKYGDTECVVSYTFVAPEGNYCAVYIYLDANDEEYIAGAEVERGAVFGAPEAPGREDAEFFGWYTDRALTKPYDPTAPMYEDTCLFPRWVSFEDICDVWIYLDAADTEPVSGFDVERGTVIGAPAEPGRDGAEFGGWYTDRALTKPYDPEAPIMEDTCLFPRWIQTTCLYGDANHDGAVNKKDSLALKKYLADNTNPIDIAAADVTGDGVVNKKDSLRLKQYLAGWDVTLGA